LRENIQLTGAWSGADIGFGGANALFGGAGLVHYFHLMRMKSETTGQGDSLVLVPGGLTGWMSWKACAEALSEKYRVTRVQLLAVDLGLQGQPLPDGYSVETEVTALAEAMAAEGIKEAHFAAWSYGALTTLSYAVRNPGRVRSLTLIEPPAFWTLNASGDFKARLARDQEVLRSLGPGDVTEDQLAWFCHFAGFVLPDVDPRTLPQWQSWVQHRQSLRNGDAAYRHLEDIKKVKAFQKPVLLFKSSQSTEWLQAIIDVLSREFPRAATHDLPGGHALHLVSREKFLPIFQDFLQRASST
jgi:pimeloyl-ACP methyl ester carboxylesterase